MSVLTGQALRRRMFGEDVVPEKRLVVTPLLDESQVSDEEASVDLRLGTLFLSLKRGQTTSIDWRDATAHERMAFERTYVPVGQRFVIHPNQFVLAQTLEYLKLPSDLIAYLVTRSSWGRTGLIVATAIGIHPNFAGVITLELRNLGDVPVSLQTGRAMLQAFFHDASPDARAAARTYTGSIEATPPRPKFEPELAAFNDLHGYPLRPPHIAGS